MKAIILAAIFAAQPATDFNEEQSWHEYCAEIGRLAEGTMEAHQLGRPLSAIMELIETNIPNEAGRVLYREITLDAYGQHAMQSERNAARQRAQFRNKWELICWEAEGEQ